MWAQLMEAGAAEDGFSLVGRSRVAGVAAVTEAAWQGVATGVGGGGLREGAEGVAANLARGVGAAAAVAGGCD